MVDPHSVCWASSLTHQQTPSHPSRPGLDANSVQRLPALTSPRAGDFRLALSTLWNGIAYTSAPHGPLWTLTGHCRCLFNEGRKEGRNFSGPEVLTQSAGWVAVGALENFIWLWHWGTPLGTWDGPGAGLPAQSKPHSHPLGHVGQQSLPRVPTCWPACLPTHHPRVSIIFEFSLLVLDPGFCQA